MRCRRAEAVRAVERRRDRSSPRSPTPCRTPRSSRRHSCSLRVAAIGADDQVVEAVAVDVARRGDGKPAPVKGIDAVEAEAVRAVERREVEARRKPRRLAEHDVALAGIGVRAWVAAKGADDDVGEAVAVDVPGRGDGATAKVTRIDAVEAEAVRAVERREIDRRRKLGHDTLPQDAPRISNAVM